MLDYKLFEALAAVVQEGGFDKAARKLCLTQSAVSQRLKLLEEQAGQILLARAIPPRATFAGRKLLKHYLQVKRLEDDLLEDVEIGEGRGFATLAVGLNADSLATWFMAAIGPFMKEKTALLDLRIDDQEQTHQLLKDGEVVGCVSTRERPMQGCRSVYLGCMRYRLLATPGFAAAWFPEGLTLDDVRRAPILVFNRKDELQNKLLRQVLGKEPGPVPTHYVPSSETFVDFISSGLAYGTLPDQQSSALLANGRLVDLAPDHHIPARLFWHCWNLKSSLLESLTRHLVGGAENLLEE